LVVSLERGGLKAGSLRGWEMGGSMLYEYRCECGCEFEARRPVKDRDTAACPKCGKVARKRLSIVNYSFGWRLSDDSHIKGHSDELVKDV
jgi:putative FmdB family regulatory protein